MLRCRRSGGRRRNSPVRNPEARVREAQSIVRRRSSRAKPKGWNYRHAHPRVFGGMRAHSQVVLLRLEGTRNTFLCPIVRTEAPRVAHSLVMRELGGTAGSQRDSVLRPAL